jgi:hypothetical protein
LAGARGLRGRAIAGALRAMNATTTTEGTLPDDPVFAPYAHSRRWAWTHYGVMVPDLPEPHRFLACMALVGVTGARMFDTDHALVADARSSATLVNGTAATAPDFFRAYAFGDSFDAADDGTLVRFGDDVVLTGHYPHLRVEGHRPDFSFGLDLECTRAVTYFVRGPIWDHLSILTRYDGSITWRGDEVAVRGTGTFEWARSAGLHGLARRPLRHKVPVDSFAYAVIDLDPDRQLLLSHFGAFREPVLDALYVRSVTGEARRVVRGVRFEVVEHQDEPAVAPDGREMRLPHRFRWTAPDAVVEGTVDTPMLYGLGSGYVGGFHYDGQLDGQPVAGQGYLEFIDRRAG